MSATKFCPRCNRPFSAEELAARQKAKGQKYHGYRCGKTPALKYDYREIVRLIDSGLSQTQVCAKLGCSAGTVQNAVRRHKLGIPVSVPIRKAVIDLKQRARAKLPESNTEIVTTELPKGAS